MEWPGLKRRPFAMALVPFVFAGKASLSVRGGGGLDSGLMAWLIVGVILAVLAR